MTVTIAAPVLTATAADKVKALAASEGAEGLMLRIAVAPGGCAGLRYQLSLDDEDYDGDVKAQYHGVTLVTDPTSLPYVAGATIDFVDTIEQMGFTIDNPNVQGGCGCGKSFSGEGAAPGGCAC
ncbi:MAG: iron-sulfur cluster assembly accessory protein [Propionibacteriaceae bacterium]|jgi:iron-sulfur cluster assembly accessory protein|nr:iron-sulfur cluster assembly accessory protein [Propionibacteriaceae bacterium]